MKAAIISPSELSGTVNIPPSKSDSHRAIICAALSNGISEISPVYLSDDIKATISAISCMGVKTQIVGNKLIVDGREKAYNKDVIINAKESASTLRFCIPIASALGLNSTFIGEGRLPFRPIGVYLDCLPEAGVNCKTEGGLPLELNGKLRANIFKIPGNISSQFISGLLFALPMLDGDSEIILTTPLESSAYVDMTINTMGKFGIAIQRTKTGYKISGNQEYISCNYRVEGDYSQASFFMSAAVLGGNININGLNRISLQGDIEAINIFKRFGADINWDGEYLYIHDYSLTGVDIDASDVPDLVPILAVTAALAKGTTQIRNASRLRIKECDRLNAISKAINGVGGKVKETDDGLIITGVERFTGGVIDSFNDHRIVMSMAIAALKATSEIKIINCDSINKSYPTFFEDYKKLGGKVDVIDVG